MPFPGSADSEVSDEQKKEKIAELKKKEKDLQDILTQKLEELKKICMREAVSIYHVVFVSRFPNVQLTYECYSGLQELTGRLPKEYPLATGEKPPQLRRRVGTAFKLDDLFPYDEVSLPVDVFCVMCFCMSHSVETALLHHCLCLPGVYLDLLFLWRPKT